jgi:hypothetical protein
MRTLLVMMCFVSMAFSCSMEAEASSATSRNAFCQMSRNDFIADFFLTQNRLSFDNPAGDLNMGLCWWDSLFQRAAVYLTVFRPELPKPSSQAVSEIIHEIIKKQNVVEIPGYSAFADFSHDYQSEISRQLSDWQLEDGFLKQSWVIDLWLGGNATNASALQKKVDQVFVDFSENHFVPFVRLKLGAVVSHALLVIDVTPAPDGYQLQVIDSNFSKQTETVNYRYGDESLSLLEDDISDFVPTEGKDSDIQAIQ